MFTLMAMFDAVIATIALIAGAFHLFLVRTGTNKEKNSWGAIICGLMAEDRSHLN